MHEFRSDINGLRGLSVVIVILYHFGIQGFSGGYVGVDIFFVISGFLMTGIICRNVEKNRFDIIEFYISRARRIIPALLVTIFITTCAAYFLMSSVELERFSKNAIASILFISNISYGQDAGYFTEISNENWLLHTWSLSIEWQFYVLYPIIAMACIKIGKNILFFRNAVILLMFISLALCIVITPYRPTLSFYLLPTRAWELLCGGIVYFYVSSCDNKIEKNKYLYYIGLMVIASAILLFDKKTIWPGGYALLPVVGVMILIASNYQKGFLLHNKLIQIAGGYSYTAYLVHWPCLMVSKNYFYNAETTSKILGLMLTVIFSWIITQAIEIPWRKSSQDRSRDVRKYITMILFSSGIFIAMIYFNPVPYNSSHDVEIIEEFSSQRNPRRSECTLEEGSIVKSCVYGQGDPAFILIGDSHADSIVNPIAQRLTAENRSVIYYGYAGCPTIYNADRTGKHNYRIQCRKYMLSLLNEINEHYPGIPVIVVNRYALYLYGDNGEMGEGIISMSDVISKDDFSQKYAENFSKSICDLSYQRDVYLLGPIPEQRSNVPWYMKRRLINSLIKNQDTLGVDIKSYRDETQEIYTILSEVKNKCGAKIINVENYLCAEGYCQAEIENKPLYYDSNHLNEFGANKLSSFLKDIKY